MLVAFIGIAIERLFLSRLYSKDPALGLLFTFGLAMAAEQALRMIWGTTGLPFSIPDQLRGQLIVGDFIYSYYRLTIFAGAVLAVTGCWLLLNRTAFGLVVRAGVRDPEMVRALGISLKPALAAIFALGVGLAALAGVMSAPLAGVQPAMGTEILTATFVVVVIGGLGIVLGRGRRRPAGGRRARTHGLFLSPRRRSLDVPAHGAGAAVPAARPDGRALRAVRIAMSERASSRPDRRHSEEIARRWAAELLARFRAAEGSAQREQVLRELDRPLLLDEDAALELYRLQPDVASGFVRRHAPRGRRAEDARLPWQRLMREALGQGDDELHFALYRAQVPPEQWARDTLELARRVANPERLCEELELRHPQRWRPDVGPHLHALAQLRGEHVLPYLEGHAVEVWSARRRRRAQRDDRARAPARLVGAVGTADRVLHVGRGVRRRSDDAGRRIKPRPRRRCASSCCSWRGTGGGRADQRQRQAAARTRHCWRSTSASRTTCAARFADTSRPRSSSLARPCSSARWSSVTTSSIDLLASHLAATSRAPATRL